MIEVSVGGTSTSTGLFISEVIKFYMQIAIVLRCFLLCPRLLFIQFEGLSAQMSRLSRKSTGPTWLGH